MTATGRLVVVRHGETEWSKTGQHTGVADVPLTEHGREQAAGLRPQLADWRFRSVFASPLSRAQDTAAAAGLEKVTTDPRLVEWDYGTYEGLRTADINAQRTAEGLPPWSLWRDGCPDGEAPHQVAGRADAFLADLRAELAQGDVAVVAHGHLLRVLAARWLDQEAAFGAGLMLGAAHVGILDHEHGRPALGLWNAAALPGP